MINLPSPLDQTFASKEDLPDFFASLIFDLGKILGCDRLFLYIRDPELNIYQIPHCYCSEPNIPELTQKQSKPEPYDLKDDDPLFAAALEGQPIVCIDDLQKLAHGEKGDFWQKHYCNQKSLIQVHLYIENRLWGFIRASQFNNDRPWTKFDRDLLVSIVDRIVPLTTVYVKRTITETLQHVNDGEANIKNRDADLQSYR